MQDLINPNKLVNPNIRKEKKSYIWIPTGKRLAGVTTIINTKAKDWLKFWSIKEGMKELGWFDLPQTPQNELKKAWGRLIDIKVEIAMDDPEKYLKRLNDAKNAHIKKSDEAKDSGTVAHDWISEWIKKKMKNEVYEEKIKDKKAEFAVQQFLEFEKRHYIEWIATELIVGTKDFAGTLDALGYVDGVLSIIDFKTNDQLSEDVFIQTAGYQEALEQGVGIVADQRIALRIPKDGSGFVAVLIPTPLSFDKETFYALLTVHRWIVYVDAMKVDNRLQVDKMLFPDPEPNYLEAMKCKVQ